MLKKIERNGRAFFLRSGDRRWVMVGENIDGKMRWEHVIDEEAARQRIWQKLGSAGEYIHDKEMEVVS